MADNSLDPTEDLVTLFGIAPPAKTELRPSAVAIADAGLKKRCSKCREQKALSEFTRDVRHRDGAHAWCVKCRGVERKAKYHGDVQYRRAQSVRHRVRTYGLTPEAFDAMLTAQRGLCAICQETMRPGKQTHVDHCHATGRVRALLCGACNRGVGIVENAPDRVPVFQAYLRKHSA